MIRIHRGPEPQALATLRIQKLDELRELIARTRKDPTSDDIDGYRIVAKELWNRQFKKCCYCEMFIPWKRQDVEHYRPKCEADRGKKHAARHGYWWLSFTWENLLFSCQNCNQAPAKHIKFPLTDKSIPLIAEQQPPRGERPLLIDPATECGLEHIQFRLVNSKWRPFARNGSAKGAETIGVCKLHRDDLVGFYTDHVNVHVRDLARKICAALDACAKDARAETVLRDRVTEANRRLLRSGRPFVGLSYDALQHFVPDAKLIPFGLSWRGPQ